MKLSDFINSRNIHDKDELISELWESDLSVDQKVKLSLDISEPDYSVLTNLWMYYSISGTTRENNELIFEKYQFELSNSRKDLSATFEYSLYFDIFEEPKLNRLAWDYFINNNPSDLFIKIMLANSGPVPYDLKDELYKKLLPKDSFHVDIYKSLRHSCFDNCGLVDRFKARDMLYRLSLEDKMLEVDKFDYYAKYSDVVNYLK